MKLPKQLTESERRTLETLQKNLRTLISNAEHWRKELAARAEAETHLREEIARLEQRARGGGDAKAASELITRREQLRLAMEATRTEHAQAPATLRQFQENLAQSLHWVRTVCRPVYEAHLAEAAEAIAPFLKDRDFARQRAAQLDSAQECFQKFVAEHCPPDPASTLEAATLSAQKRIATIENILSGGDVWTFEHRPTPKLPSVPQRPPFETLSEFGAPVRIGGAIINPAAYAAARV